MKKNIQVFICTLVMLISSLGINVKASTFDNTILDKYVTDYKELTTMNVAKNKEFYITFSKEMDYKTINSKSIKVINCKGEEIDVTPYITTGNKKVVAVRGPQGGYIEGETYALIVKKTALDINSQNLNKDIVMEFTVKNTSTQDTPNTDANKSENELFIENLYKTNSPYWNQGLKFIDGKLNIINYDYTTWKTLSTGFNSDINKQIIDVFKSLYTEKEGYKTEVEYGLGEDGSGIGSIAFYGKNLTSRGESFITANFYTSAKATIINTNVNSSLLIPQCSLEQFNNNKYLIKNPLSIIVGETNADSVYKYITDEYKKCVLDNSSGDITYSQYNKTFGNIKVYVWSNGRRFVVEFIKI